MRATVETVARTKNLLSQSVRIEITGFNGYWSEIRTWQLVSILIRFRLMN